MRYSLVLQFRGNSLADFDAMIALEDDLTRHLGKSAVVDGHDCGSGEMNIFIFCSDPRTTFDRILPILDPSALRDNLKAAFREVDGNDYTVVWPKDCAVPFKVV